MVKYEIKTKYKCPYCTKEYISEDDAMSCAQDCVDIEYPEEVDVTIYLCEYCDKKSEEEDEASECEKKHEEKKDDFYHKVKLIEAQKHPNQSKLDNFSKWKKLNQPITIPPVELDKNGKLIIESIKIKKLDFNKKFHPEFTGYMVEQKDGIWISFIEAKEIGKGHFSLLIKELKEKYNWIKIPTPSNMMMKIATHLGFDIKNEYFESPYECMGTIMIWHKEKQDEKSKLPTN